MRRFALSPWLSGAAVLVAALALAFPAHARKTEARCGLSAGAVAGPTFATDNELHDEFPYFLHIELNAKYYVLWNFSISGDLGYEYGEGAPKRFFHEGELVELDGTGQSFWRAMPYWATLRVEPFRKYPFNPYLGAAAGGKYLVIERKGHERTIPLSNSGDDWLVGYMGVAGFDWMINKFFFFRLEGRYSSIGGANEEFFRADDYGTYDGLAGINVYF
ncbi:outer membrane beta-barrel protein [bacterium]|nr:outer membrane beta-barrel protein [bacterium]